MRLHKFIAQNSPLSLRKTEELIKQRKITVNNRVIDQVGVNINPEEDIVRVNGKTIIQNQEKYYILLHKPPDYLCTVHDPFHRKTVLSLLPPQYQEVYPVGRLDKDTTGLLLLTNNGDFAEQYTHPRFNHQKEYVVEINGIINKSQLEKLRTGMIIDGYKTKETQVKIILEQENNTILSIILGEGRKRQIREMIKQIGKQVFRLKRIRIDNYNLGDLKEGQWRLIKPLS
jgi:pseudouridine synthase